MNCFNSDTYLKEAIDSVYRQTYDSWEIVFWDNCSTDNSAAIANSYDEKLKYYLAEENISLGAARNKAIAKASGEFIAFLDCDDLWFETKLEKQIKLFDDNKVVLVYSDVIEFNGNKESRLYSRRNKYVGECFSSLLSDYFLSLPSVVIRGSTLRSQPYFFDERYRSVEEAELFFRLALVGDFDMVDEPLAKYRMHEASLTSTEPDMIWKERYLIVDGFAETMPEVVREFAKEIAVWVDQTKRVQAMSCLNAGDCRQARSAMKGMPASFKKIILYLCTFLPRSSWELFKSMRGSVR